ncbi:glycine--tRNA ligase subunit beta [Candidatus Nitrospira inopinata]|jgi:glycyl-tRNA synthetase beta chain|uniref:Glycine--tRNA ligase beta subunit n=1 Tax=Candidatus Nitrospira inopinata TaxID=1715989 RepID=A0A0S4KTQ3_9BACT|nr:glycine--tRNA ligase subunit beta [Candidatus Nitrospira inopinata]CUQ67151.1 Glycine--tRNA ligase beta subunit [Candidatus Nitrospira inopinata]
MDKPKKAARRSIAPKSSKAPPPPVAQDLLLEVGVEELPYQFVAPALVTMKESSERLLKDQRLAFRAIRTMGTPRRLTMVAEGLAAKQSAVTKETMGPPKAAAFDQAGQPTKAAIGFASTHGVPVQSLEVRRTPKGEYLFAVKHEEGRPAASVLMEVLPPLVAGLAFPKAMKWNETGVRFARPIRWVLAIYGGTVLPFDVAGVTASNQTTGHRVMGGGKWIRVKDADSYSALLERQGVIVDPQRRRHLIQRQIDEICREAGFELHEDETLLDQAVYSTESPTALIGSFKETYLDVPEEILMTSMKEHQGFFSLRRKETGRLAPHFIAVANTRVADMSLIRTGNERVLEARLADAKFFFDEDRKARLSERVPKLSGVTFHQKLGTMAQKQERVKKLTGFIAAHLSSGQDDLPSICERAAALAKADLVTGIVGEFPELQGIMGGVYALHDGEPAAVAQAIREQYLPKTIEGELPRTLAGQVLSLADRLDSIAAFFHVGVVPTGSEDPFALRRQATAVVRIMLEADLRADLAAFVDRARQLVSDDGFKGLPDSASQGTSRIIEFILERVRHYCRVVRLLRDDVIEAVLKPLGDRPLDLVDLVRKMKALEAVTRKPEFDALLIGFKRAHRLVEKEEWTREAVDPTLFQHAAESDLHRAVMEARTLIEESIAAGRYDRTLDALIELKPSIDGFFSAVMVNAEDQTVRRNRLSLLKDVDELFASFADFSQIMVQGG